MHKLLRILHDIKGHLVVVGFILTTIGTVTWGLAKPIADDYVTELIVEGGFITASAIEDIAGAQKNLSTRQEKIVEDSNKTADSVRNLRIDNMILNNKIDNLIESIDKRDQEQSRDMREIRRLLLNR